MYKTINGRYGPITFLVKDAFVGKSLWWYGEFSPDESETIVSLASGLCLDIGANIGCISQALIASGNSVIAFEPQPELFGLLEKNCNCQCHNVALGSANGTATMPKVHYSEKNNFGGLGIGDVSLYGNIYVQMRTLDSFNLSPSFIKIDVEGYELEVLRGGEETIKRCKPIMYIEDDRSHNSKALRQFITSLGYSITEDRPALYREKNFFNLKRNVWEHNYASYNLICLPLVDQT